jgi:DNA-directed RNA polymerase specialized sigma24 family protein
VKEDFASILITARRDMVAWLQQHNVPFADAEDITQNALMGVWDTTPRNLKGYLYRAMRYQYSKYLKERSKGAIHLPHSTDNDDTPASIAAAFEEAEGALKARRARTPVTEAILTRLRQDKYGRPMEYCHKYLTLTCRQIHDIYTLGYYVA